MEKPFVFCSPIEYKTLEAFCAGTQLPATATNDKSEDVIITTEPWEDSKCYRIDTYQKNNWIRINRYYSDGSVDETYER
jgi:hypothetical protein